MFVGCVIYRWKGIFRAPKFQTSQLVDQKNKYALELLTSSRCPTLFGETHGSLMGYDLIKAHGG